MLFRLVFFVLLFLFFFLIYYLYFLSMLKKEKYMKISELVLLTKKFNLDKKKMNYKKLLRGVAIINGFIISLVITIIDMLKFDTTILLMIAFVLLMTLIYVGYMTYGKFLNKKWGIEDGK